MMWVAIYVWVMMSDPARGPSRPLAVYPNELSCEQDIGGSKASCVRVENKPMTVAPA